MNIPSTIFSNLLAGDPREGRTLWLPPPDSNLAASSDQMFWWINVICYFFFIGIVIALIQLRGESLLKNLDNKMVRYLLLKRCPVS